MSSINVKNIRSKSSFFYEMIIDSRIRHLLGEVMPINLSSLTSRQAVLEAIEEAKQLGRQAFLEKYNYKRSRRYTLMHEGQPYDSKAIVGVAFGKQHGTYLTSKDFSGGLSRVVPLLKNLGFHCLYTLHPAQELVLNEEYERKYLVDRYGGQLQAGIWTPKEFPVIFLFTGGSGETFGYVDGWKDGVFQYTGAGQIGDMEFTHANKSIRDHRAEGKDILLFEEVKKSNKVRYKGLFELASWENIAGKDKENLDRKLIVFNLIQVSTDAETEAWPSPIEVSALNPPAEKDLRAAAYAASEEISTIIVGNTVRHWRKRSDAVKEYVLSRAKGVCEACDLPAPFKKRDGTDYLEPHHTNRLADDGPDSPLYVGAICPNCHRRIHSGSDGSEWNQQLLARIRVKESNADKSH